MSATTEGVDPAQLVGAWRAEDPRLGPAEKETLMRFAKVDDRVVVDTTEAGIGRRVLAHPLAEIHRVTVLDEDGEHAHPADPATVTAEDAVVGVRATLPLGVVTISSSARESDSHADIVSDRVLEEVSDQ